MKKTSIERFCETCGQSFWVQPYRLKESGNPGRFCSSRCMGEWRKGKTFHFHKLQVPVSQIIAEYLAGCNTTDLARRYDVTPTAICYHLHKAGVEVRHDHPTFANNPAGLQKAIANHPRGINHPRYRDLPVEEILSMYEAGHSADSIARHMRTSDVAILRRLRAAGMEMRSRDLTKRWRFASDGQPLQSTWELVVDNWLTEHSIDHIHQPLCPWKQIGRGGHWRADFKAGNFYIEVWGMTTIAAYEERRQRKLAKYREHNNPLIQIFPHHILDGDYSPLEVLLSK